MQRREKLIQDAVVAVQDQVPEQRQDDRAEHHRNEQDGEDDGLAGHAVAERQRQHEPEHELDGDRQQHEQGRRGQRVGVLRLAEQHRVVARADRLDRAARQVGVGEAEIDVEQKWKQIHREQQERAGVTNAHASDRDAECCSVLLTLLFITFRLLPGNYYRAWL